MVDWSVHLVSGWLVGGRWKVVGWLVGRWLVVHGRLVGGFKKTQLKITLLKTAVFQMFYKHKIENSLKLGFSGVLKSQSQCKSFDHDKYWFIGQVH